MLFSAAPLCQNTRERHHQAEHGIITLFLQRFQIDIAARIGRDLYNLQSHHTFNFI